MDEIEKFKRYFVGRGGYLYRVSGIIGEHIF